MIPHLAKWTLRSLADYRAELATRRHAADLIEAATWMAVSRAGRFVNKAALTTVEPFTRLRERVCSHRDEIRHFFRLARAAGKSVYGYGASTKGNIVLNYCGIGREDAQRVNIVKKHRRRTGVQDSAAQLGMEFSGLGHLGIRVTRISRCAMCIWVASKVIKID